MFTNVLDGLDELGFADASKIDINLLNKKEVDLTTTTAKSDEPAKPEDCLYEKNYKCPICDANFKANLIRRNKLRIVSTDTDLRSYYTPVDPIYYDIVMCQKCGYTALINSFQRLSDRQMMNIMKEITPKFKTKEYPLILNADHAIERYKFALLNSTVKGSKTSEKAYLCMKIAWLYREKKDAAKEKMFLENAYVGFKSAYGAESFPMCGLDENTLEYMLGEFARRLGYNDEANRWFSHLLLKRTPVNSRLKERAEDQRILVKDAIRLQNENNAKKE